MSFLFSEGVVVRWSVALLADGRKRDPRWYETQKRCIGVITGFQSNGDVLVAWEGSHETCLHPPERLQVVSVGTPLEVRRSVNDLPRTWHKHYTFADSSGAIGLLARLSRPDELSRGEPWFNFGEKDGLVMRFDHRDVRLEVTS